MVISSTKECGIPGPNIGYMPQDLSLITQFTVRETLEYYAGFAATSSNKSSTSSSHANNFHANYHKYKGSSSAVNRKLDLDSRIEFLLKLLDISEFEHAFTDNLSGGQKRRVSLAVAMINDPPLLILDEPTVGVDPIVRDAIWSYLVEQSRNGLTIIVTTHYIEEAASAHKVGFMRQGRILAEGNPDALMRYHKVPTLESLFLKLSRHDDGMLIVTAGPNDCGNRRDDKVDLATDDQVNLDDLDGDHNRNHNLDESSHSTELFHVITVTGNGDIGSSSPAVAYHPHNNNNNNNNNFHHHQQYNLHSKQQQQHNHHSLNRHLSINGSNTNVSTDAQLSSSNTKPGLLTAGLDTTNNVYTNVNGCLPTLPPTDYDDYPEFNKNNNNNNNNNNGIDTGINSNETNNNNNNNMNGSCCMGSTTSSGKAGAALMSKVISKSSSNLFDASPSLPNGAIGSTKLNGSRSNTLMSVRSSVGGVGKSHRAYSVHSQSDRVGTWQKVGVLCRKHRLRLFRRVPELVITMLLPALEVALFCLCMGRDPTAIQMAVCNQEKPPFMSMVFLKSIDPDFIQLKYYATPQEAIDSVRNADTYSAIVLAKNFTASMQQFAAKVYPQVASKASTPDTAATSFVNRLLAPVKAMGTAPPAVNRRGTSHVSEISTSTTAAPMITMMTPTEMIPPAPAVMMSKTGNYQATSFVPSNPIGALDTPGRTIATSTTPISVEMLPLAERLEAAAPAVTAIPIDIAEQSSLQPNTIIAADDSIIKIYYDGSNALHVNIIRRELFSAVFRFIDHLGKLIGHAGIANHLPIKFEKPIYGTEKTDMIEFVGPGLMVFIVFFATMSITSMAFLSERREGTLERSMIVGMTPTEFIISQIINITFLLVVQITLTVVMGFWIFNFPMNGSYVLAVMMMFCQGLCGMTYGLMLSAICTNEMTALMLGAGSQLMFCFITGIFWPVDTMIPLLRYFSYMMPQTLPMESFRHILIRGFDLSRAAVWNGYIISIGWIIFFLILAIVIFRFR